MHPARTLQPGNALTKLGCCVWSEGVGRLQVVAAAKVPIMLVLLLLHRGLRLVKVASSDDVAFAADAADGIDVLEARQ